MTTRRFVKLFMALTATCFMAGSAAAKPAAPPIPIKTVVVTAFERGADTGDAPGEYQAWATANPEALPFPAGERRLRIDRKRSMLVVMTGIGTNRAATTIAALGHDPRFDLRRAYWLVAAIAGVNPNTASAGSAAWIGDVVDTDYGYAIDPREAPAGWTVGMLPRDRKKPFEGPRGNPEYNLFPLNKGLRDWAYALTKDVPLADTPALQQIRAGYPSFPAAKCPPYVLTGDEATGQTFWHGALLNRQVEQWVAYWTDRPGSFVMTGMEDSGVAHALAMLDKLGKADSKRLMILRTGSNYAVQPEGHDAASSLIAEASGLSALQSSLDAAFTLGNKVVNEISTNWPRYRDNVPQGPATGVTTRTCG